MCAVLDADDVFEIIRRLCQNLLRDIHICVTGEIIAPEGSKLFPLVSFVSGIEDGEIHCTKYDIDDAFQGKTFKMKAKKQKGKRAWFKIIPLEEKDGGVEFAL